MTDRRFVFRFSRPYRLAGLAFGVWPSACEVRVGDGRLRTRFGPWSVETALDNITDASITGPYRFVNGFRELLTFRGRSDMASTTRFAVARPRP